MTKYICTVRAIITESYEVEDTFEIDSEFDFWLLDKIAERES